jgi:hypothetical protein
MELNGRLRAAEHNEYEIAFGAGGAVIEDLLGVRFGARFFQYGGEYRNQLTGRLVGQEETISSYATSSSRPRRTSGSAAASPTSATMTGRSPSSCRARRQTIAFRASVRPISAGPRRSSPAHR